MTLSVDYFSPKSNFILFQVSNKFLNLRVIITFDRFKHIVCPLFSDTGLILPHFFLCSNKLCTTNMNSRQKMSKLKPLGQWEHKSSRRWSVPSNLHHSELFHWLCNCINVFQWYDEPSARERLCMQNKSSELM